MIRLISTNKTVKLTHRYLTLLEAEAHVTRLMLVLLRTGVILDRVVH